MTKEMRMKERKLAVFCMEFMARQLNDEEDFWQWLVGGVSDGDFDYWAMVNDPNECLKYVDESYISDKNFAELMEQFLICMRSAGRPHAGGGLYCDGIVSKKKDSKGEF